MRATFAGLLAAAAGVMVPLGAQTPSLMADTNRDGMIEWTGDSAGKGEWNWQSGAVFLYNMDDDNGDKILDCEDTVVNGAADVLDLALFEGTPLVPFPSGATYTLTHNGGSNVRLFYRDAASAWTLVPADGVIPINLLTSTATFAIEGRSFATGTWNGQVTITARLSLPSGSSTTDAIRMRVAPFLMIGHSQEVQELFVRAYPGRNDAFISALQSIAAQKQVTLRVIPGGSSPYPSNQIWLQDQLEVGYTEMPGRKLHAILRANRNQAIDEWPRRDLLRSDVGFFTFSTYRSAFAGGGSGNGWLDWFGNLEVTPPYDGHPYGRIYYGKNGTASLDPNTVAMLAAQEIQGPPVALDTGWLLIKHVDEMLCFVPSNEPSIPWKVIVPDTAVMEALLDRWITQGHGTRPILPIFKTGLTVSGMRNQTSTVTHNRNLQTNRINPMIESAKTAFGLTEANIIRIPAWYEPYTASESNSMVPNMVNSVVINGSLLVADPDGPVVNSVDLLEAELRAILTAEQVPLEARFLDDRQYHIWNGNVHCGTNVQREPFQRSLWQAPTLATEGFLVY